MTPAARDLITAFQAAESIEQMAPLLAEDGFDAEALRLLQVWTRWDHRWTPPADPVPDDGRPTARAYGWLVRGLALDYVAIGMAANVSRAVARQKLALLLGAQLVYPDGSIAKTARAALTSAAMGAMKKKRDKSDKPKKPTSEDDAN